MGAIVKIVDNDIEPPDDPTIVEQIIDLEQLP